MKLTLAAAAVGLGVALLAAGVIARGDAQNPAPPKPGGAVTSRPGPTAPAADPGRPGEAITWTPGPWGEVTVAGHRLLIPASAEHGPLRDRSDGWASDYPPTEVAAAIALLRGPWLVFAAPAPLRPEVMATVLTPQAAAEPGPVNPGQAWALPTDLIAGLARLDIRTLGAVARLSSPKRAEVDVFQQRETPGGPVIIRSTHRLRYDDRQWLIEADFSDSTGVQVPPDALPTAFTVAPPEVAR